MKRRNPYPKWFRRIIVGGFTGLAAANIIFPPPLDIAYQTSTVVTDKDGQWLSAFSIEEGRWRIKADIDRIDPRFIERLIWVEDKRFMTHTGVDPISVARASKSWVKYKRAVSGASTLTMQLVRQLEHRPRTLPSKAKEMLRALQIEARLSKTEILELYLTHISYGGVYEGIEAASHGYFGKSPTELTDAEIALLIAIPQAPEARRPDRNPKTAKAARDALLTEFADAGLITFQQRDEAIAAKVPTTRSDLPKAAWLTSHTVKSMRGDGQALIKSTIDKDLQNRLQTLAKEAISSRGQDIQASILVVENKTMAVRASIGNADRGRPGGWIDMTGRKRSPGSTLKPFIYGMAFDDGLATPGSNLIDMPARFGNYQPENFTRKYYGDVTVAQALQHSLNIPAVAALDAIGEARFAGAFKRAGIDMSIPRRADDSTGLALALGGVGMSSRDLAVAYAALPNEGMAKPLRWFEDDPMGQPRPLIRPEAAAQVTEILRKAPRPKGHVPAWLVQNARGVAYKTGTSYGFRDAWAAGYTHDWTVIAWVGRVDGSVGELRTGRQAAAPLLFDTFAQLEGVDTIPYTRVKEAPAGLTAFDVREDPDIPVILFPSDRSEVLMDAKISDVVILKGRSANGEALNWYVDGEPLARREDRALWAPKTPGFYKISAVNESGRKAVSRVKVMGF